MSDETASDVHEIIPQTETVLLSSGLELKLSEPTYQDFADGERMLGRQPGSWLIDETDPMGFADRMRHYGTLLWILGRKNSSATLEQVLAAWTFRDFSRVTPRVVRFFASCLGLELRPVSPGSSDQGSASPTA